MLEPAIRPLGFDWRIGVGLVTSFAAREVLVSTLGIVFSVGDSDETSVALRDQLREAKLPNGKKAYNGLVAVSIMVFFVLACQCMATLAVIKRETNSWRWPLFVFAYMTVLAWIGSFVVYQGGLALGFGT
jgi:ferrous iron transport protein B